MAEQLPAKFPRDMLKSGLQAAFEEGTDTSVLWRGEEYRGVIKQLGTDPDTIELVEPARTGRSERKHLLTVDDITDVYFWNPP